MMHTIHLDNLSSRYINLGAIQAQEVKITGKYKGDRIVFSNAASKQLFWENALIECTRLEEDGDAILFDGIVSDCEIHAHGLELVYGGITMNNRLVRTQIKGGLVHYANTGLRISQDFAHEQVLIMGLEVHGARREGIYFGPHFEQKAKSKNITIAYCKVKDCGWDGIQINADYGLVYGNIIDHCAKLRVAWQDYGLTIQPGSKVYAWENTFKGMPKPFQALQSTLFNHQPNNFKHEDL